VDPDELREGMEVRACLRRAVSDSSTGIIQYIIKFGPARNGDEEIVEGNKGRDRVSPLGTVSGT